MNKKTKLALIIGAVAAVVSAVVVVIVFWDKLIAKFPCCCKCDVELDCGEDEAPAEEFADYADVEVDE